MARIEPGRYVVEISKADGVVYRLRTCSKEWAEYLVENLVKTYAKPKYTVSIVDMKQWEE